ncbi:unnamed protein product [Gongylonema pulchrum]|uniref:Rx_N domain-containing protein n=1 Tax=Gongylonema pulchrum TaxID=637853 RepID=A0A183EQA4_9BILA|nr:unnamed protein product [Gongylonema pulchrum]
MAGLSKDTPPNSRLSDVIHSVVGKIRSFVRARAALSRITHSLRTLKRFSENSFEFDRIADALKLFEELKDTSYYPTNVCAKLTDFRMITAEQFFVSY